MKNLLLDDWILLTRICGVSHDLAEILRERKDLYLDDHVSKHLDFITNTLEGIIEKYSSGK